MLGSSYGSTNGASIDPLTGKRLRAAVSRHHGAATSSPTQHALLDHLGIEKLVAIVGPSYGGFQAFQWAVDYPGIMRGDRGDRHVADGAARALRGQCRSACSPPCRRIRTGTAATITIVGGVLESMIQIRIATLEDLWHRDPPARHPVRPRADRGGDPRRGHALGQRLRRQLADHPGEGAARLRRHGAVCQDQVEGAVRAVADRQTVSAGTRRPA